MSCHSIITTYTVCMVDKSSSKSRKHLQAWVWWIQLFVPCEASELKQDFELPSASGHSWWRFLIINTFKNDHELLSQPVALWGLGPTKPLTWWKSRRLLYRGCEITARVSDNSCRESSYREMCGSVWKSGSKYLSHMRRTFIDRAGIPQAKALTSTVFLHTPWEDMAFMNYIKCFSQTNDMQKKPTAWDRPLYLQITHF